VDTADKPLPFAAFGTRSFCFQWPADLFTSWAFEMETLILAWYVMVHTGSVLLLTVFGSLQFFGMLVAPMFGVLGGRIGFPATVSLYCGVGLIFTVLIGSKWRASLWHA